MSVPPRKTCAAGVATARPAASGARSLTGPARRSHLGVGFLHLDVDPLWRDEVVRATVGNVEPRRERLAERAKRAVEPLLVEDDLGHSAAVADDVAEDLRALPRLRVHRLPARRLQRHGPQRGARRLQRFTNAVVSDVAEFWTALADKRDHDRPRRL